MRLAFSGRVTQAPVPAPQAEYNVHALRGPHVIDGLPSQICKHVIISASMKPYTVPSTIFKDPDSASRLQLWLEHCSAQQRHICLKLLASLNGSGSFGGPGAKTVCVTSRPSTATGCRGVASITAQGQKCSLAPRRPQTANARPRACHEHPLGANTIAAGKDNPTMPMCTSAWMTTNDQFYGFRRLYPAVYNTAAEASRAVPAANMLFTSEYADSLKVRKSASNLCI